MLRKNKYCYKLTLPKNIKEDAPEAFNNIIKDGRARLVRENKIVDSFIEDGDPVVLSFNTKEMIDPVKFAWEDDQNQIYTIELEVNPMSQTDIEIQKSFVPYSKWTSSVVHERFWDKLKLAFSKKKVYTDD